MAQADGTPVWFELTTPEVDAAQTFYQALAGWTIAPSPNPAHGDYRVALHGEAAVAGLMAPQDGMPTGWTIYFAAADVDALAERVRALGGKVMVGPMDIPDVGRFAAVADPQGVMFNLMRSDQPDGPAAFMMSEPGSDASVGHAAWIELATPDPDGAFAFYGALFGWTKGGAMPMGDMGEYAFIGEGGDDRYGAVMSSTATGAPSRWNWYVHVPDIDAAVATAQEQGGALRQGPDEIPGGSFSANVTDAQGLQIGLVGPRAGTA